MPKNYEHTWQKRKRLATLYKHYTGKYYKDSTEVRSCNTLRKKIFSTTLFFIIILTTVRLRLIIMSAWKKHCIPWGWNNVRTFSVCLHHKGIYWRYYHYNNRSSTCAHTKKACTSMNMYTINIWYIIIPVYTRGMHQSITSF